MKYHCMILLLFAGLLTTCGPAQTALENHPPEIETGINPKTWATIPAGEFLTGRHNHEGTIDYDFEIMVTDVTNAQYARYLNDALADGALKIVGEEVVGYYPGDEFHGYKHEEEIHAGDWRHVPLDDPGLRLDFDGETFSSKPGYENHPMVLVTWFGAKAFCDYYGWRLPNELEWEKAARGQDGRPYPWGDEIARNNANYYSSHDILEKIAGRLGDTTPVGFFNGGTYDGYETLDSPSPYGLYDMAGNVWQWTGDIYEGIHYRFLRGGSKSDYAYNLRVWTRNNATPTYASPNVGFRCVR
jgi:formylglycine-generating enzyme required for sulfatase activity